MSEKCVTERYAMRLLSLREENEALKAKVAELEEKRKLLYGYVFSLRAMGQINYASASDVLKEGER